MCSFSSSGITTQAVNLYISKAFDRVWHKGLLVKLEAVGIRGQLPGWFRDYLTNRRETAVIKGEESCHKRVMLGVSKGSVLGPLLFLTYVYGIPNAVQSVIKLFAYDSSMSLASNNQNIRADILNSDLQIISNWAKNWKVKLNEE